MNQISDLIREAKPLYFARKKRREYFQKIGFLIVFLWMVPFWGGKQLGNVPLDTSFPYFEILYNDQTFDMAFGWEVLPDNGSVPVDEFGLVRIV